MKKRWLKDNRGAALVSVMIAVAFIAILASTLLYMAYSNYKMKVVNYEAKVNFYGTEHDMTVLSTNIRNEVAKATGNPVEKLYEVVGSADDLTFDEATGKYVGNYYSPNKLAAVVYGQDYKDDVDVLTLKSTATATVNIDADRNYGTGNANAYKVTYSSDNPTFSIEDEIVQEFNPDGTPKLDDTGAQVFKKTGVTKITLNDIKISQVDLDGKYENTIVTDMVFRVKEETPVKDAGGIGKFSVLSDSGVSTPATSDGTRIEMYGNVFLGPEDGEYAYSGGKINPGGKDALVLDGDTVFTAYGDYMVVFGNIRLKDRAILQVVGGNLTVYGDIILEGAGSGLICTGNVYFPADDKPGGVAGEKYKILTPGSTNVLPQSLMTKTLTVDSDKYLDLLTTLGLTDNSTNNDGILNQILSADGRQKLNAFSTGDHAKTQKAIDMFGIKYNTTVWVKDNQPINDGNLSNNLCFMVGSGCTFGDAAVNGTSQNLNTTFICLEDIKLTNTKSLRFSQVGSEVFNFMLTPEGSKGQINNSGSQSYMEYDAQTHMIIDGQGVTANNTTIASLFQEGNKSNEVVNKVLGLSSNGSSAETIIHTAIGYENWHKE
ncbi:MAG: hypothetical protein IJA29_00830 [Lachnospiraceae bacterium]|nr:hypothetical protein [Lachnospiraceae bacterium]